jgi:hypothetical protein
MKALQCLKVSTAGANDGINGERIVLICKVFRLRRSSACTYSAKCSINSRCKQKGRAIPSIYGGSNQEAIVDTKEGD